MEKSTLNEHFHHPFHRGSPISFQTSASLAARRCGDEVTLLYLVDSEEALLGIWHTAKGCLVSQAAASHLCQLAQELDLAKLQSLSDHEFLADLEPLTPMRRECALLSLRCLRKALQERI